MGDLPQVDTNQDPSSYFYTPGEEDKPSFMQKNKPFFDTIHYYLVQIWPYVNRALATIVYFFIGFIKGFVKIVIDQIKNFRS